MSAASHAYWNEERGEYGYWLDEGRRRWVHCPEAHPDAWQVSS